MENICKKYISVAPFILLLYSFVLLASESSLVLQVQAAPFDSTLSPFGRSQQFCPVSNTENIFNLSNLPGGGDKVELEFFYPSSRREHGVTTVRKSDNGEENSNEELVQTTTESANVIFMSDDEILELTSTTESPDNVDYDNDEESTTAQYNGAHDVFCEWQFLVSRIVQFVYFNVVCSQHKWGKHVMIRVILFVPSYLQTGTESSNVYLLLTFDKVSAPYSESCSQAFVAMQKYNGYESRWCGNRQEVCMLYALFYCY